MLLAKLLLQNYQFIQMLREKEETINLHVTLTRFASSKLSNDFSFDNVDSETEFVLTLHVTTNIRTNSSRPNVKLSLVSCNTGES